MTPSEFATKTVDAYESNTGIFDNKINAEDLVPNSLSGKGKSLYLFYVIQLDYATKSQRLYEGAKKLHDENSDFFNPQTITNLSDEELEKYLKNYLKPRYINEAVLRYKHNSIKILDKYDGDPRKIFTESDAASEALKRVLGFRGFGPKIGNFFVRTMINAFGYAYKDIEEIMPPVDVHDVKIAYLMGYVDSKDMTKKNIDNVKALWSQACKDAGVSWLVFDKALWLLGSEGLPKTRDDVLMLLED